MLAEARLAPNILDAYFELVTPGMFEKSSRCGVGLSETESPQNRGNHWLILWLTGFDFQ